MILIHKELSQKNYKKRNSTWLRLKLDFESNPNRYFKPRYSSIKAKRKSWHSQTYMLMISHPELICESVQSPYLSQKGPYQQWILVLLPLTSFTIRLESWAITLMQLDLHQISKRHYDKAKSSFEEPHLVD